MIIVTTLTFRTSLAWNSGVQLWWMKPIPPVSWQETIHQANTISGAVNGLIQWVCISHLLPWQWPCWPLWLCPSVRTRREFSWWSVWWALRSDPGGKTWMHLHSWLKRVGGLNLGILTQNPQWVTQLTTVIITDSDWFNYTIAAQIWCCFAKVVYNYNSPLGLLWSRCSPAESGSHWRRWKEKECLWHSR